MQGPDLHKVFTDIVKMAQPTEINLGKVYDVQAGPGEHKLYCDTNPNHWVAAGKLPPQMAGRFDFTSLESLARYTAEHSGPNTRAYMTGREVVVVFDDHDALTGPGWGCHRADLALEKRGNWKKWRDNDRQSFPQAAFADFLEENLDDVVDPPAADLFEVVTNLQATVSKQFNQAIRLDSGAVSFTLNEEVKTKAGKTRSLEMPTQFTLGVTPFKATPDMAFKVKARLRFRLHDSGLSFSYHLQRLDDIEELVADKLVERLTKELPCPVFRGVPASVNTRL